MRPLECSLYLGNIKTRHEPSIRHREIYSKVFFVGWRSVLAERMPIHTHGLDPQLTLRD